MQLRVTFCKPRAVSHAPSQDCNCAADSRTSKARQPRNCASNHLSFWCWQHHCEVPVLAHAFRSILTALVLWIFADSQIFADARVFVDSRIFADLRMFADSRIHGFVDLQMCGFAESMADSRIRRFVDLRIQGLADSRIRDS